MRSLEALVRRLEQGRLDGPISRMLAAAYAPLANHTLARPALDVRPGIALVCVGGATLGGSGKTPLALACTTFLAGELRVRVALVGHAYRGALRRRTQARVVDAEDAVADVGDEALVCAEALRGEGVRERARVVVGSSRQAAIDLLERSAFRPDVLVLDGPLLVRGRDRGRARAETLRLLAVDAEAPWGSGRVPPAGDLRAERDALLASSDLVVPVSATPSRVRWVEGDRAPMTLDELASWARLQNARVGLFTAIARPDRLTTALARAGLPLSAVISIRDHGPMTEQGRAQLRKSTEGDGDEAPVTVWLATAKCVHHLAGIRHEMPKFARLGVLDADVTLASVLQERLRMLVKA